MYKGKERVTRFVLGTNHERWGALLTVFPDLINVNINHALGSGMHLIGDINCPGTSTFNCCKLQCLLGLATVRIIYLLGVADYCRFCTDVIL